MPIVRPALLLAAVALPVSLLSACSSDDASSAPVVKASPRATTSAAPAGGTAAAATDPVASATDLDDIKRLVVGFNDHFYTGDLEGACKRVSSTTDAYGVGGYVQVLGTTDTAPCVRLLTASWRSLSKQQLDLYRNTSVATVTAATTTKAAVKSTDVLSDGTSKGFAVGFVLTKSASGWQITTVG